VDRPAANGCAVAAFTLVSPSATVPSSVISPVAFRLNHVMGLRWILHVFLEVDIIRRAGRAAHLRQVDILRPRDNVRCRGKSGHANDPDGVRY
jgi:hypothetical protein